jgi:signal transduction histidine kinase
VSKSSAVPSLSRQLAVRLLLGLAILGVFIIIGAWFVFLRFQLHLTAQSLDDSSERLIAAVRHGSGGPFLDQSRLDPVFNQPLSGEYFLIRFADTHWRSRSLWDSELLLAEQPEGQQRLAGPAGQRLLVRTHDYQRYGEHFHITVASDYTPLQREFQHALIGFVTLWLLALLLTLVVLLRWLRLALQPLEVTCRQLASIQAGETQWLSTAAPQELQALIHEINELLGQTRESLQRSRNALGNFSHALKTPLAVLSNLVEREEIQEQPELQRLLRVQIEQLNARMSRELSRARSAAGSGAFEPFYPGESLPLLLDALSRAHDRKLRTQWDASGLTVLPLDRSDLLEILGNALDNAWKWARSEVSVRLWSSVSHWHIDVEDDGPGIVDTAERQLVLMRGQRLDESTAGQGLGLSIIAETVATYGGKFVLDQSALGGLAVRVSIPKRTAVTQTADEH